MLTSALPLVFIVLATGVLVLTGNLFTSSPFGIAAQVAAVGLNVWARRSFQQGTFRVTAAPAGAAIITRGPYRVIRHPMYAAVLLFIWTAVLTHVAPLTVTIGVAVTVVCVARVVAEERLLNARYAAYRDYTHGTKALVPFLF